jgi:hypothetical protein
MKKEHLYGHLILQRVFAGDGVSACSYRFYCRRDVKDFFVRCLRVEGKFVKEEDCSLVTLLSGEEC